MAMRTLLDAGSGDVDLAAEIVRDAFKAIDSPTGSHHHRDASRSVMIMHHDS
jgi:hypothetical protein